MNRFYHAASSLLLLALLLPASSIMAQELQTREVVANLSNPWEIIWGPDDWIWMTERAGKVSRVNPETGQKDLLLTVPDVRELGEGGLLGMALHPNFADTAWVFLVYNYQGNTSLQERLVRYTYNGSALVNPVTLIEGIAGSSIHNGSRVMITPDRILYMTTGDAAAAPQAQNHSSLSGKILRMRLDGSVPPDNPFPTAPAPFNLIWSTGHRNAQGLVLAPNGIIYSSEHGANSDDEINIIDGPGNRGWPNVQGPCSTADEIKFCGDSSVVEPIRDWSPTIATAGLDYYDHPAIPEWSNSLLLATLKESDLRLLKLSPDGRSITGETIYFNNSFGRLRDICIAPDGRVFVAAVTRIIEIRGESVGSTAITVAVPDSAQIGDSIDVTVTTEGTFDAGNIFTIELSNSTGSFVPSTNYPKVLGSFQAVTGRTWRVKIPCTVINPSSQYIIRARSSSPADTSSSTGPRIRLYDSRLGPIITPSGQSYFCTGDSLVLRATPRTAMVGYLWSTGETTDTIIVKEAGTYAVSGIDSNGCSVQGYPPVEVQVVSAPTPIIRHFGSNLSTLEEYPGYQWILNGEPIPGATERNYVALVSGQYSVRIRTDAGCYGMSAPRDVVVVAGVGESGELSSALSIFPQPVRDRAVVAIDLATAGKLEIVLRDMRGTTVARFDDLAAAGEYRREISTTDLAPGVYFVTVTIAGKSGQVKLVRE